ncbi:MAG: nicotinate-nucleotide--dimethylbenzimidazole phosphoribosyltransferase [Clostridiales bacterium]|nr:nicotinate-nucleotide--dimethylbenzimidazole phosphoribosyltransferase [Clostridiales bacterium]
MSKETADRTKEYLDSLAKPPGSLGELEHMAVRISSITGSIKNNLNRRIVLVFSADNGVVEEGIASGPKEITALQTINMLEGRTGVSVLAKHFGSDLCVTDVGVDADLCHKDLVDRKIRRGTSNIAKMAAMSLEEAIEAVFIGMDTVKNAASKGYQLIGIGEMGIGNTTTSSALLAALLGLPMEAIEEVVGKGAGLTKEGYEKKLWVVKQALLMNQPDRDDPLDCLQKVGGFDLAAMTGAYLGAALYRIPVVIDGFISIVAALCAARLCKDAVSYMFASHHSHERGYELALKALSLRAPLHLDMRLGEGSGCPLMFSMLEAACMIVRDMATFEQANINTDYLEPLKSEDAFS